MFVDEMFVPWIEDIFLFLSQSSSIDVCNEQIFEKLDMFMEGEDLKNILSYCDFSQLVWLVNLLNWAQHYW